MKNFNITDWVDEFFSFVEKKENQQQMEDHGHIIFNLAFMEAANKEVPQEIKDTFIFQVIKKRAEAVGLNCNDYVITMLTTLCSTPAHAVMWTLAFRHLQDAEEIFPGKKPLLNIHAFTAVTQGFIPSEEFMYKMWDAQKNRDYRFGTDNWLDAISSETAFIQATRKGFVELRAAQ